MADKKTLRGATAHNIVLKGGGYATLQRGDEVPDDIHPDSLKRLNDSGVLDNELPGQDWETLARLGTGPAPAADAERMGAKVVDPAAPVAEPGAVPPTV